MFVVIVDIAVKKDFIEQFREAVTRQGNNSLTLEEGCLGFDILQDPADPTRFLIIASGRTPAAIEGAVRALAAGSTAKLVYLRDGQSATTEVTLGTLTE